MKKRLQKKFMKQILSDGLGVVVGNQYEGRNYHHYKKGEIVAVKDVREYFTYGVKVFECVGISKGLHQTLFLRDLLPLGRKKR